MAIKKQKKKKSEKSALHSVARVAAAATTTAAAEATETRERTKTKTSAEQRAGARASINTRLKFKFPRSRIRHIYIEVRVARDRGGSCREAFSPGDVFTVNISTAWFQRCSPHYAPEELWLLLFQSAEPTAHGSAHVYIYIRMCTYVRESRWLRELKSGSAAWRLQIDRALATDLRSLGVLNAHARPCVYVCGCVGTGLRLYCAGGGRAPQIRNEAAENPFG